MTRPRLPLSEPLEGRRTMLSPFRQPSSGRSFYARAHAGAAELKLAYALDEGLEAAMLLGAPGLGKSTILRRLAARAAAADRVVVDMCSLRIDGKGLFDLLVDELGGADAREHASSHLNRLGGLFHGLAESGRGVVILIDDAHMVCAPEAFEALQLVTNLAERAGAGVTVILAGQATLPQLVRKAPGFAQRIAVAASLAPLTGEQTGEYIRHRLRAAGQPEGLFDEAALAVLQDRCGGVPRRIDRVCEMAMIVAASEERAIIAAGDVEVVAGELGLFDQAAA